MKPPSEIVADLIASYVGAPNNLGWILAKNLFVGKEPEEPAECMTIFDYEGGVQNPKLNYDMVHVQVRLRFPEDYISGYKKIKKISVLLNGISPFNSGTDRVEGIWIQNPVNPIGRDNKDNHLFTLNLRLLIIPTETGNRQ